MTNSNTSCQSSFNKVKFELITVFSNRFKLMKKPEINSLRAEFRSEKSKIIGFACFSYLYILYTQFTCRRAWGTYATLDVNKHLR